MRPESQDRPASRPELDIRVTVPKSIAFDLRPPPSRVRFRPRAVRRATVPEASVYENRDLGSDEGNIGPTARAGQRDVNSVSQANSA